MMEKKIDILHPKNTLKWQEEQVEEDEVEREQLLRPLLAPPDALVGEGCGEDRERNERAEEEVVVVVEREGAVEGHEVEEVEREHGEGIDHPAVDWRHAQGK